MSRKQPPRLCSKRKVTYSFSPQKAYFNLKNIHPQTIALPGSILSHVVSKLSPKTTFKLSKTCKYMKQYCDTRRGRALDALFIGPKLHYDFKNCMAVQIPDNSRIFKLFITGISIEDRLSCDSSSNPNTASTILKLTKFCSVKDLYLEYQELTLDELEVLGKNVNSFLVSRLDITDSNPDVGMLQEVMERIPNAAQIEIQTWEVEKYFSASTANFLENLEHKKKIIHFEIDAVPEDFDAHSFGLFIEENLSPKCETYLHFQVGTSRLAINRFRKTLRLYRRFQKNRNPPMVFNTHPPTAFTFSAWRLSISDYIEEKFRYNYLKRGHCQKPRANKPTAPSPLKDVSVMKKRSRRIAL